MNSIIAGILRNQITTLQRSFENLPHNLYLIDYVLPDGLPGNISYAMVMEELEKLADELENEE